MSEVKYAIAILKEKLANADRHNLAYQRLSIAEMEAIRGTLEKSDKDFAALKAERDALAAENVALKAAIAKYAKVKQDFDDFDGDRRGIAACLCEAEDALVDGIETPATDAFLNSVRADGAIAVRDALVLAEDGADIYATSTLVANQLRAGEPS